MMPTKTAIAALVAAAAGGALSGAIPHTMTANQISPGIDARMNTETATGVKALALSALTGAGALLFGSPKTADSIARGLLYASGLGALVGLGMIAHGQQVANTLALQGKPPAL